MPLMSDKSCVSRVMSGDLKIHLLYFLGPRKCPFPSSSFWNTQVQFPWLCCFALEPPSPTKRGSSFRGRGLVLEDLELTQAVEAKGGLAASRQPIFSRLPIVKSKFSHQTQTLLEK